MHLFDLVGPWSTTSCCSPVPRPPAPDAIPARESEAGASSSTTVDPRVLMMIEECWRHAKVIGAWGEGITALG